MQFHRPQSSHTKCKTIKLVKYFSQEYQNIRGSRNKSDKLIHFFETDSINPYIICVSKHLMAEQKLQHSQLLLVTNSMQQIPPWETKSHSATKEILGPSQNPKVRCLFIRVHRCSILFIIKSTSIEIHLWNPQITQRTSQFLQDYLGSTVP